jgi:hypothetical protein
LWQVSFGNRNSLTHPLWCGFTWIKILSLKWTFYETKRL